MIYENYLFVKVFFKASTGAVVWRETLYSAWIDFGIYLMIPVVAGALFVALMPRDRPASR